jgi:ubiquinone biosynthesis protein COQ4
MKWRQIREVWRAKRAGASIGDIAVMKFAMYSGPAPEQQARLRALELPAQLEVDLAAMRRLPEGTVGRAFARHLDDNGLMPLVISEECKRRYADNPLAIRYTTTHDLFHVLTGFPTTPAGELGLFAFMLGQGFALGGHAALRTARWIYSIFLPLHVRGMLHNIRVGEAMGRRAANLLEQPLEALLERPLVEVRRALGLPEDPARAGVDPGRESLLVAWLMGKKPAPAVAAAA